MFVTIITSWLKTQRKSREVNRLRKLVLSVTKHPLKDPTCPVVSALCPFQSWRWGEEVLIAQTLLALKQTPILLRVSGEELAWWRRGSIDVRGRFWQISFCLDRNSAFPARTKREIQSNTVPMKQAATNDLLIDGFINLYNGIYHFSLELQQWLISKITTNNMDNLFIFLYTFFRQRFREMQFLGS